MFKHITFYTIFVGLFQGFFFLNRDEVIADYQPLLTERANDYSAEHTLASAKTNLTIQQIENQTWITVTSMNTQIATLKQTIVTAINASTTANNTDAVACLTVQQTAANTLTSVPINSTCLTGVSHSDLLSARDALGILSYIPNNTIAACGSLNPLASQDESFLDCITHKILDLDQMIDVLTANFTLVNSETFDNGVQCLADQTSLISEQINEINFQVTVCTI